MLKLLQSLWSFLRFLIGVRSTPPTTPAPEIYSPGEREIYQVYCGQGPDGKPQYRDADPLILWQRLMDRLGRIQDAFAAADIPQSKFSRGMFDELTNLIREVFDVRILAEGEPRTAGGVTRKELQQMLEHFWGWADRLKKNSLLLPMPAMAPSVPSVPSSGPGSVAVPTTSNSSGSPSTANGHGTGSGPSSPSGSPPELAAPPTR